MASYSLWRPSLLIRLELFGGIATLYIYALPPPLFWTLAHFVCKFYCHFVTPLIVVPAVHYSFILFLPVEEKSWYRPGSKSALHLFLLLLSKSHLSFFFSKLQSKVNSHLSFIAPLKLTASLFLIPCFVILFGSVVVISQCLYILSSFVRLLRLCLNNIQFQVHSLFVFFLQILIIILLIIIANSKCHIQLQCPCKLVPSWCYGESSF